MSKFKPTFLLHGRWPARYRGIDDAARQRGWRFYHKVEIVNEYTDVGNEISNRASTTIIRCCDEEVQGVTT